MRKDTYEGAKILWIKTGGTIALLSLCLVLLAFIDQPKTGSVVKSSTIESKNQQDLTKQKRKIQKKQGNQKNQGNLENAKETLACQEAAGTLTLVVGKTGSLKKGGSEPIYEAADAYSMKISELQYHCAVLASGKQANDKWISVDVDGTIGYVKKDTVEIVELPIDQVTDSPLRNKIIMDAVSYLGLPFVRYGKSLETGIDCSNFVQQIFERSGVSIANTPNKIKEQAVLVKEMDAQPGDIVYYDVNNGGGHVGIYLGGGLLINSAGHAGKTYPKGGVRICCLQYKDRENYEFYRII